MALTQDDGLLAIWHVAGSPSHGLFRDSDGLPITAVFDNTIPDVRSELAYKPGQRYRTEVRVYRVVPEPRYEPGPVPGSLW